MVRNRLRASRAKLVTFSALAAGIAVLGAGGIVGLRIENEDGEVAEKLIDRGK